MTRFASFVIFAGSRACHVIFACRAGRRRLAAGPRCRGAGRPAGPGPSAARCQGRADRPPGAGEEAAGAGAGDRPLGDGDPGETAGALGEALRERGYRDQVTAVTGAAITELAPRVGIRAACRAVGAAQAGWYRRHRDSPAPPAPVPHRQRRQPRALAPAERQAITGVLHGERLADVAPAEARATLLEEGTYPGSAPTFYLVLRERGEVRERRRQAARPATVKPELMAGHPNAVRSWDITKLAGPAKWTWHYLYVITDICSRHVTGWMVATRESAALAERLIAGTCANQGIGPGKLTIHADRGSSMTARPVAFLLAGPGITQSRSRPRVSNDNPYSESQFKTPKYRPGFPARSGSIEHARAHCQEFFPWYNREHRHAGLGLHTAADVRHGRAQAVRAARAEVPSAAHAAQPGTVRPPAAAAEAT